MEVVEVVEIEDEVTLVVVDREITVLVVDVAVVEELVKTDRIVRSVVDVPEAVVVERPLDDEVVNAERVVERVVETDRIVSAVADVDADEDEDEDEDTEESALVLDDAEFVDVDDMLDTDRIVRFVAVVVEVVYAEELLDVTSIDEVIELETDNNVRAEDTVEVVGAVAPVLFDVADVAGVLEIVYVVGVDETDRGTTFEESIDEDEINDAVDVVEYTPLVDVVNVDAEELVVATELADVVGTDKTDRSVEDVDEVICSTVDVLETAEVLKVENVAKVVGTDSGIMLDKSVDEVDEDAYTVLVDETGVDADELIITVNLAEVVGTDKMDKSEEDLDALEVAGTITDVVKVVWLETPAVLVATEERLETFKIEYADDPVVLVLPDDSAGTVDIVDTPGVVVDTDCKVTAEFADIAGDPEVVGTEEPAKLLAEEGTDWITKDDDDALPLGTLENTLLTPVLTTELLLRVLLELVLATD